MTERDYMLSRLFKRLWARFKEWAIIDDEAILAAQLAQIESENAVRRLEADEAAMKRRVQESDPDPEPSYSTD